MTHRRRIFLATLACATLLAAAARAEKFFPVNDNSVPGVFDQPSVAMNGAVAHVAFIGGAGPAGPFRVHYAAVNGGADFTNLALTRGGILLTAPTVVDNAAGSPYYDARHPEIAMRTATELVIFFQARQTSLDTTYSLYRARVRIDNNLVVEQRVNLVTSIPPGDIRDVSFALVTADNTARLAYASRSVATDPFDVSFARVGLDNADAAAPVAVTTAATYPSARGFRPVPSVKLDDLNRAHIAWAATDASGTNPGPVYYAMVRETNGVDNMVIAPSQIMTGRGTTRYAFPNLLVLGRSLVTVLAGDEVDGGLAYVQINPDAARQNGRPAWDNLSSGNAFLPVPPGEVLLAPEFRLFRPEAVYEPASGRIFLTGYGSAGPTPTGATFLAIKINTAAYSADIVTGATPFALEEFPGEIDGDYTKARFGFPGGKALVFWSGMVPGTTDRNLDVTTVPTVAAWVTQSESGCSVAAGPGRAGAAGVAGVVLLFLPALVLAARRAVVSRVGRAGRRGAPPAARAGVGWTVGR